MVSRVHTTTRPCWSHHSLLSYYYCWEANHPRVLRTTCSPLNDWPTHELILEFGYLRKATILWSILIMVFIPNRTKKEQLCSNCVGMHPVVLRLLPSISSHLNIHANMSLYVGIYSIYIYSHVYTYMGMYICTGMTYIHIWAYIYMFIYIYIYRYVYMHACMHACKSKLLYTRHVRSRYIHMSTHFLTCMN